MGQFFVPKNIVILQKRFYPNSKFKGSKFIFSVNNLFL
jgi:hypothetical protein